MYAMNDGEYEGGGEDVDEGEEEDDYGDEEEDEDDYGDEDEDEDEGDYGDEDEDEEEEEDEPKVQELLRSQGGLEEQFATHLKQKAQLKQKLEMLDAEKCCARLQFDRSQPLGGAGRYTHWLFVTSVWLYFVGTFWPELSL